MKKDVKNLSVEKKELKEYYDEEFKNLSQERNEKLIDLLEKMKKEND